MRTLFVAFVRFLEHVTHTEFASYLLHIDRFSFVDESRISGDRQSGKGSGLLVAEQQRVRQDQRWTLTERRGKSVAARSSPDRFNGQKRP